VPLLLLGPPFFTDYSFRVHHLVNRDDRHLLAHAMASDFSVCPKKSSLPMLYHYVPRAKSYNLELQRHG
jgi:hypothetical protein